MRFCECGQPVFSTDKITRIGYCKSHSYKRTDTDKRSIVAKAMDKQSKKTRQQLQREKGQLRPLIGSVGNREMSSRANLIEDLDTVVSRIVRLRGADKEGNCKCYTCPKVDNWKAMQCGHYISRSHLALRFDTLWNTRVQCPSCNIGLHGNLIVYAENLDKEEPGITDRLYEISKEVAQMGNDELKGLLDFKREQLRIIEDGIKQKFDEPKK